MWSIQCLVNTVKIQRQCANDLFVEGQDYEEELWSHPAEVTDDDGQLQFSSDHMEGMDYLASHDKVINILQKYRVEGNICFGSLEGDNAGSFWGYRFDGKGGIKHLKGNLVWKEKNDTVSGKTFAITGSLPYMSRAEAEAKIRNAGGKISRIVSSKTHYLVVGSNFGSKFQKAKSLGVKTISSRVLLEMLGE